MSDKSARVLDVLSVINSDPDRTWGVREVSSQLELSPATTYRLLSELASRRFVEQTSDRKYRSGLESFSMAATLLTDYNLVQRADIQMRKLTAATAETIYLSMYDPLDHTGVFLHMVRGSHPLTYIIRLGTPAPLTTGAAGKAILSALDAAEAKSIVKSQLDGQPPSDVMELMSDIADTRSRGYSVSVGEKIPGVVGIGAPVYSATSVLGALSLTMPEIRWDPDVSTTYGNLVKDASRDLSTMLGHS